MLELTWSTSQYTNRVFVSASPTLLFNTKIQDEIQLDPHFAALIGIKDNEQVRASQIIFNILFVYYIIRFMFKLSVILWLTASQ